MKRGYVLEDLEEECSSPGFHLPRRAYITRRLNASQTKHAHFVTRQKAILSKRQKPAGLRRGGQDGRNLISLQPTPPSLQRRSAALRSEREERGTQWKDCFPCRENFSMFISDIALPDESGRGGGRLTQTAKHSRGGATGAAQTKCLGSFWKQRQAARPHRSPPVVLPFCVQGHLHACSPSKGTKGREK